MVNFFLNKLMLMMFSSLETYYNCEVLCCVVILKMGLCSSIIIIVKPCLLVWLQ
jgi:hypothetical protein